MLRVRYTIFDALISSNCSIVTQVFGLCLDSLQIHAAVLDLFVTCNHRRTCSPSTAATDGGPVSSRACFVVVVAPPSRIAWAGCGNGGR
jgi:hypothetical protein